MVDIQWRNMVNKFIWSNLIRYSMNDDTMFQHVSSPRLKDHQHQFFSPPTLNPGKREATSNDRNLQVVVNKSLPKCLKLLDWRKGFVRLPENELHIIRMYFIALWSCPIWHVSVDELTMVHMFYMYLLPVNHVETTVDFYVTFLENPFYVLLEYCTPDIAKLWCGSIMMFVSHSQLKTVQKDRKPYHNLYLNYDEKTKCWLYLDTPLHLHLSARKSQCLHTSAACLRQQGRIPTCPLEGPLIEWAIQFASQCWDSGCLDQTNVGLNTIWEIQEIVLKRHLRTSIVT